MRHLALLSAGIFLVFNITCTGIARGQIFGRPTTRQAKPTTADLSAEKVQSAIRRGVNYLRSDNTSDSSYKGGLEGLKALAMLNAGVSPKDPDVAALINKIRGLATNELRTYSLALRVMVLAAADPAGKLYTLEIRKDVKTLIDTQVHKGFNTGGWTYGGSGSTDRPLSADPSNSQFALLALHEAVRVGVKVNQEVWELAAVYWGRVGKRDGGFAYSKNNSSTGSMTCGGISSWMIISENLETEGGLIRNGKVVCCAKNEMQPYVKKAIAWMGRNFTARGNPQPPRRASSTTLYYYLYALERAGRLAGQRFFGPFDWYREGTARLLALQNRNGSWLGGGGHSEGIEVVATSFALLFLSKGKRPVVFGKYQHSKGDDWDRHPKGIHQMTRNLEKAWSRKLNWQTVRSRDATVNDLLEARVLVISGRDNLELDDDQKQTLKKYVESGGFVLAVACQGDGCGQNVLFHRKFTMLMRELFPESKLEVLPPDHPIWTAEHRLLPEPEFPILGLRACCRTSVLYCPRPLSARWQVDRRGLREQLNGVSLAQVEWCTKLGVNIAAYVTGRKLRDKLDTPQVDMGDSVLTLKERVLVIPKLLHAGGSDEAPNAWRNILREARESGLRIKVDHDLITANLDQLIDHPFVFMHGRTHFTFSEDERNAIKQYVKRGGFLLVDSICASKPFSDSFRREMKIIFKQSELIPIPADHPLWTNEKFGYALKSVTLRIPDRAADGGFREVVIAPEMDGLAIDGRLQIIFSPHDLSCAMENAAGSQCEGYSRDDAAVMAVKILLYVLRREADE